MASEATNGPARPQWPARPRWPARPQWPRCKDVAFGRSRTLLYQPMAISRRAVLKTLAATAASTVTGFGAYGYLYERHQLLVTKANMPVAALPPALAGFRIGFL